MKRTFLKLLAIMAPLPLGGLVGVLTTSCGDFLEPENKAAIEAEGYFNSDEGQQALRVVMYNGMKSIADNTSLTEYGTDLYVPSRGTSAGSMGQYTIVAENSDVTSFYQSAYAMINNANCMLKYGGQNAKFVAEPDFITHPRHQVAQLENQVVAKK